MFDADNVPLPLPCRSITISTKSPAERALAVEALPNVPVYVAPFSPVVSLVLVAVTSFSRVPLTRRMNLKLAIVLLELTLSKKAPSPVHQQSLRTVYLDPEVLPHATIALVDALVFEEVNVSE